MSYLQGLIYEKCYVRREYCENKKKDPNGR